MSSARVATIVFLIALISLGVVFGASQCCYDSHGNPIACPPSTGSGQLQPCTGDSTAYGGCISSPGVPPVTIVQPPLTSIGGFSSGSWWGTHPPTGDAAQQPPSALYHYGIVDASNGPAPTIPLCGGGLTFSPSFKGGATTLYDGGLPVEAFWYITSIAYARDICNLNVSDATWGQQQASWFVLAIDSLPTVVQDDVGALFIDLESANGDPGEWLTPPRSDNVAVVTAFFSTLCGTYALCSDGMYTGYYDFQSILGAASSATLGIDQAWISSFGPPLSQDNPPGLDQQEQEFTNVGYSIYSWQYASDICEMTYSAAANDSDQAIPPIPRFDKWTNSHPEVVC